MSQLYLHPLPAGAYVLEPVTLALRWRADSGSWAGPSKAKLICTEFLFWMLLFKKIVLLFRQVVLIFQAVKPLGRRVHIPGCDGGRQLSYIDILKAQQLKLGQNLTTSVRKSKKLY